MKVKSSAKELPRNITPEEEAVIQAAVVLNHTEYRGFIKAEPDEFQEALMELSDAIAKLGTNRETLPEIIEPPSSQPDYEEFAKKMGALAEDVLEIGFDHVSTYVMAEQHFSLALAALKSAESHMLLCTYLVRRKE